MHLTPASGELLLKRSRFTFPTTILSEKTILSKKQMQHGHTHVFAFESKLFLYVEKSPKQRLD